MVNSNSAKKEVYDILKSVGTDQIEIFLSDVEDEVIRDEYNSIIKTDKNTNSIKLYAFPVSISPTQLQREKVGIVESCDIMFHLSKYELDLKAISNLEFSNIRGKVIYNNIEYNITESTLFSQFGNDFLYVIIAGHRK